MNNAARSDCLYLAPHFVYPLVVRPRSVRSMSRELSRTRLVRNVCHYRLVKNYREHLFPGLHRVFSYKLYFHDGVAKTGRNARRTFAHDQRASCGLCISSKCRVRVFSDEACCIFSDFLPRDGCICFLGAAKLILQDVCTVLGAFG